MDGMNVNRVINDFGHLPLEDKEYVAQIIEKQLVEAKRMAVAQRGKEAKDNFEKGLVKEGSVKDLQEDLESD